MGSYISYYLNTSSMQLLEDYMKTYNSISYAQYTDMCKYYDNANANANADANADANANANADANDSNYYKLYIYVHNATENMELKNMYEDYSEKHNNNINKYLESHEQEVDVNKFINCYDSGFDLFCPDTIDCINTRNYMLDHNVSCAMTYKGKFVGYYLYMRSSTPVKTPLRLANNVGIIDSGYRGNIKAYFDINGYNFNFVKGHRYMQICPPNIGKPMKVVVVDCLSILGENNARNKGGYGSTGN